MIESLHRECDLLVGDRIEAQPLRKELTNEAVHILVGAPLPRGIGVSEEEASVKLFGNPFVLGKFLAVIRHQRMHAIRKRRQQREDCIGNVLRGFRRNVGDQCVAGSAFIDRHQGLLMSGNDDQISLPVTEALAAIGDVRTQVDRGLIGNGAASRSPSVALSARLLAAQSAMQGSAHPLVSVDALVDAFVTDAGLVVGPEIARDLLGTPGFGKFRLDDRPRRIGNPATVVTGPPVTTLALASGDSRAGPGYVEAQD